MFWLLCHVWRNLRKQIGRVSALLLRLHDSSLGYPESLSFSRSSPGDGAMLCGKCNSIITVTGSKHVITKVSWVLLIGWLWMCCLQCSFDCLCWSEVSLQFANLLLSLVLHWFHQTLFLGRLLQVDLIKPASMSVYTYVHTYICPSTKSFSDSNEIWCVGRGRWVMH